MHLYKNFPALVCSLLVIGGLSVFAAGTQEGSNEHAAEEDVFAAITPVEHRLNVVATTNIIGDVLKHVAGGRADVTTLMPHGQSPHGYEPTPRALAQVEDADLVFVNGFQLEEQLLDDIAGIATGYIISVSAGIEPLENAHDDHDEHHDEEHDEHDEHHDDRDEHHDEEHDEHDEEHDEYDEHHDDHDEHHDDHDEHHDEHSHGKYDPHVWFSPRSVMQWTRNMERALSAADPDGQAVYTANAEAYIAELKALDSEIRAELAGVTNRKLVVDHSALAWFAHDYELSVVGVIMPSMSDIGEVSAQDFAMLSESIERENVRSLFVGESASRSIQQLANVLADEKNIQVFPLLTGSLAREGEIGDTYLTFMRFNAAQIVKGLVK